MTRLLCIATAILMCCSTFTAAGRAADAPKPLKALLIAGGCCHDYKTQKDILKKGIEERANVVVDILYSEDRSVKPPFSFYGKSDYATGYDVVIHDECAAGISDPAVIEGVLKPHRDGIPGVNLHCAMHCYRIGNPGELATPGSQRALWFDYLGLQSSGHGPQAPIEIRFNDPDHPITKGMADWTTVNEEHYNNVKIFDNAHPLAMGKQIAKQKKKLKDGTEQVTEKETNWVVAWTSAYNGKTRVFSTTIGHNNITVGDARYLDLVTRGMLWACDKLAADGKPKSGYGPPNAK
ncbi:MAG: ThuA domain-containing protein [Verrucomicrobia bacterium]|nr:ThuA domain-containing protein [Verrucomicrobiota bacterium]